MIVDGLLELGIGFQYLCGRVGGTNRVRYVDILEAPEDKKWFSAGDFIITSGFFFKDDPMLIEDMLRSLIAHKCSGLAIRTGRYVKRLPDCVIALAEAQSFPIMTIPPEIGNRDIQSTVIQKITAERESRVDSYIIKDKPSLYANLMGDDPITGFSVQEAARRLGVNADSPRYVMVAPGESIMTEITYDFPDATLILRTTDGSCACVWDCGEDDYHEERKKAASAFFSVCKFKTPSFGISDVCLNAERLRTAYLDAHFAMNMGHVIEPNTKVHLYSDYYMHRLIHDSLHHPAVLEAARTYTKPLLEYDRESSFGLFPTLISLCRANFNIQRACQELNIHRNTLYVRIEKIRSITGLDIDNSKSRLSACMAVVYEQIEGYSKK